MIEWFQVIWVQGYQKHKKPKVLRTLDKVKNSYSPLMLSPTVINPKKNPNQNLINGLFWFFDKVFIFNNAIKNYYQ